jgi:hypothetical protein
MAQGPPPPARVPVIAISGTDEAPSGIAGFFRKPSPPEKVLAAVAAAIKASAEVGKRAVRGPRQGNSDLDDHLVVELPHRSLGEPEDG